MTVHSFSTRYEGYRIKVKHTKCTNFPISAM